MSLPDDDEAAQVDSAARESWEERLVRDRLFLFTMASLILWGTWAMTHTQCHPYADLSCGTYTDHFSHMNTARLFTHVGTDIWTKPLMEAVPQLTPEQLAALPEDMSSITADGRTAIGTLPGTPPDKPFISSWGHYPRFHPPGNMVLTAPVALLYSFTPMSFSFANELLILLFLVFAHIAFFVFVRAGELRSFATPLGFAAGAIVYLEMVHWALEGFYEPFVIAPLVLAGRFLAQKRALPALLAYAAAVTLHFRALFFAPWALYAVYLIVKGREWRTWTRGQYVQVGAIVLLSAVSLGVFSLLWPHLHTLEMNNPVTLAADPRNSATIKMFIVIAAGVGLVLAYSRAWLDIALLAWFVIMLLFMRQAYPWEVLSLLAWFGAPILTTRSDRAQLVRDARLVGLLFIAGSIFANPVWPYWLQRIVI